MLPAAAVLTTALLITSPAGPPQPQVKPPLTGLTSIAKMPHPGYPVANRVILVPWSRIEPAPGRFRFAGIDQQLAESTRAGLHVKLRIMAGLDAPDWAKRLSGGGWAYRNPAGRVIGTAPRWWNSRYGDAYHTLMAHLAGRYDRNPTLREVALSRCMTLFAEPLWREWSRSPQDRAAARAAGYSDRADRACQQRMVTADAALWHRTHVDLALTGAPYMTAAGRTYTRSPAWLITALRGAVGARGIVENNQLTGGSGRDGIYRLITHAGGLRTFQVQTFGKLHPSGVPGLLAALRTGCIRMRAASVELPAHYDRARPAQLAPYARACT